MSRKELPMWHDEKVWEPKGDDLMLRSKHFLIVLTILAGVLISMAPVMADTWSLPADFSATVQGNHGWSYGMKTGTGASLSLFAAASGLYTGPGAYDLKANPGVNMWGTWSDGGGCVIYTPNATTLSRYAGPTASGIMAAGQVGLATCGNPYPVMARWTAATDGDYTYNVTFSRPVNALNGVYVDMADPVAGTRTNLTTEAYLSTTNTLVSFVGSQHLIAGQCLEFVEDAYGTLLTKTCYYDWGLDNNGNPATQATVAVLTVTITQGSTVTAGAISGVVKDTTGNAIVGATVTDTNSGGGTTITGTDGRYTLLAVPVGSHVVQASKTGYSTEQVTVSVASGQTATGDITTLAASFIRGTITDSVNNIPVAGVTVYITGGYASTTSASDGTYSFQVSPGTYDVTAHAANYTDNSLTGIVVTRAQNNTGQNILLTPVTGSVSGTVTDSASVPLSGVTIQDLATGGPTTTTASNGTYLLNGVAPGSHTIRASKIGYSTEQLASVNVAAGLPTTGQNFTLTASFIKGTVTDANTHAVISGATVSAVPGGAFATTGSDGAYTLQVAAGTFTVTATKSTYLPGSLTNVIVAKGGTVTNQNIGLKVGWDLASSFRGANPDGVWSYRYINEAGSELGMEQLNMNSTISGVSWTGNAPTGLQWYCGPTFTKNTTGNTFTDSLLESVGNRGSVYREAGKIVARAGYASGLASIARFTVPIGGVYTVTAKFAGADVAGSVVPVAVRQNGTYIFGQFAGTAANGFSDSYGTPQVVNGFGGTSASGYADSFGDAPTFSQDLDCAATDTIDAMVMYPGSGQSQWVQCDLTIAAATSGVGTVSGVVKSDLPGNPPLAGATVELTGGSAPYDTVTASDGSYSLTVKSGVSYNILVQLTGQCKDDNSVNGLLVNSGQTYTKNFTLQHLGTWNVANDYSITLNPNGQWSYRTDSGTLYTPGIFTYWLNWRAAPAWGSGDPANLNFQAGWVDKVTDVDAQHPVTWSTESATRGYVDSSNGRVILGGGASIRWTSPYDTQKIMNVNLTMMDLAPMAPALSCQIKKNGTAISTKTVQGFVGRAINGNTDTIGPAPTATYLTDIILQPGDYLDFNTAYLHDGQNNFYSGFPNNEGIGVALIISPGSGAICTSVGQLRTQPVNSINTVFLTTPTAAISDLNADHGFADSSFYIEDADKSAGIKCLGNPSLVQINVSSGPKNVTLSGKVILDPNGSGQRVLSVDTITSIVAGTATPNSIGTASKSFASSTKPINVRTRVWGKLITQTPNTDPATNVNWPWLSWTINDGGQNITIGMIGQQGQLNTGNLTAMKVNDYISVTGISTLDSTGNVVIMPWNESCLIDYAGS